MTKSKNPCPFCDGQTWQCYWLNHSVGLAIDLHDVPAWVDLLHSEPAWNRDRGGDISGASVDECLGCGAVLS